MSARQSASRVAGWLPWLALAFGLALFLRPLALFWSVTPEYSFGWGVPFLAGYLAWLRGSTRPAARPLVVPVWAMAGAFLTAGPLLFALRLLLETEPGWRPALWVDFALLALLSAGWLALAGGLRWVRHFGFPLLFLALAVPWPWNLEAPLVQLLMRTNTQAVADLLTLADIPVVVAGHTLVLAAGRLGVEEACSGIRTLQTSLLVSLFLGEFLGLTNPRRLLLVLLTITAAIVVNGARLLVLALVAIRFGIPPVLRWHDSAGELELAVLLASGVGFAYLLRSAQKNDLASSPRPVSTLADPIGLRARVAAWAFCALAVGAEIGTQSWYEWREGAALARPAWTLDLPTGAPAFAYVRLSQITLDLLRCDAAQAARWQDGAGREWTADWFRYRPRPGNKIVVAAHNPLICLPQLGWRQTTAERLQTVRLGGVTLRVESFTFSHNGKISRVFWTVDDRQALAAPILSTTELYQPSGRAFLSRAQQWIGDIWRGSRGADAETLEVTLTPAESAGPDNAAYRAFLQGAIHPSAGAQTAVALAR